jgi:hypothetical protein
MKQENKYYIDSWLSKSSIEKIEFNDYIDTKVKEYTELGLTVYQFMGGTFVEKNDVVIYSSREPIVHFMKFIDVIDDWLLRN